MVDLQLQIGARLARAAFSEKLRRQVLAYLLVQFLPMPTGFAVRGGGVRPVRDYDGTKRAAARLLGLPRENVRYYCKRVEHLREQDADFDAALDAIEQALYPKDLINV